MQPKAEIFLFFWNLFTLTALPAFLTNIRYDFAYLYRERRAKHSSNCAKSIVQPWVGLRHMSSTTAQPPVVQMHNNPSSLLPTCAHHCCTDNNADCLDPRSTDCHFPPQMIASQTDALPWQSSAVTRGRLSLLFHHLPILRQRIIIEMIAPRPPIQTPPN